MPKPHPSTLKDGSTVYRVRFRDGARNTSKSFWNPDPRVAEKNAQWFCQQIDMHGVRFALKMLEQYEQEHGHDDTTDLTLDDVFEEFITWKADFVRSPRTIDDYRTHYEAQIKPTFGSTAVDKISPDDVQVWVERLIAGKLVSARTGKRLSPKTIQGRHALLHSIMDYAASPRRRYIDANPCTGVDLPRPVKPTPKGIMPAQWQTLYPALVESSQDTADLAAFLVGSGWRYGEAAALTPAAVEDYGPEADMWITMQQVVRRSGKTTTSIVPEGKAQKSMRRIRLDAQTAAIVRRRCKGLAMTRRVFTNGGQPWTQVAFYRRFTTAAKSVGLTKVSPHWLRHSHVLWMAMSGASLPELQKRIGHANIQTTINVYGTLIGDVQDTALDAFTAMRGAIPEPDKTPTIESTARPARRHIGSPS